MESISLTSLQEAQLHRTYRRLIPAIRARRPVAWRAHLAGDHLNKGIDVDVDTTVGKQGRRARDLRRPAFRSLLPLQVNEIN